MEWHDWLILAAIIAIVSRRDDAPAPAAAPAGVMKVDAPSTGGTIQL
jgi:hypothetical protein